MMPHNFRSLSIQSDGHENEQDGDSAPTGQTIPDTSLKSADNLNEESDFKQMKIIIENLRMNSISTV